MTARNDGADVLGEGRFARLVRRSGWEFVERCDTNRVVSIAARSTAGTLVLVEQYREPFGRRVIELPAGLVGDEGEARDEAYLEAARRELLEETGFVSEAWNLVARGSISPGLTIEDFALYTADQCVRTGAGGGVGNEEIIVHEAPLAGLAHWLEERKQGGCLVDAKVWFGALAFAPLAVLAGN